MMRRVACCLLVATLRAGLCTGQGIVLVEGTVSVPEGAERETVVAGLERSLSHPREFADERSRVVREVLGEIDGHAADRVVDAIVETVSPDGSAHRA